MKLGLAVLAAFICFGSSEDCIDSRSYKGTLNVTISGRTCLRWDSELLPERWLFPTDARNYCRDPSNRYQLWCFTNEPELRKERCNITVCEVFDARNGFVLENRSSTTAFWSMYSPFPTRLTYSTTGVTATPTIKGAQTTSKWPQGDAFISFSGNTMVSNRSDANQSIDFTSMSNKTKPYPSDVAMSSGTVPYSNSACSWLYAFHFLLFTRIGLL